MKMRNLAGAIVVVAISSLALGQNSEARVRQIILSTRHLGAHGMGYNTQSLWQLSRKLTPADIPVLISIASSQSTIAVGAQFALASQCGPSVEAVRDVVVRDDAAQRKFIYLDAEGTLQLISEFEGCSAEVQRQASDARAEVQRFHEEEYQRIEQESKQKADDDARIQRNGLKLLNPEQAKTLTHEERLEVYRRSLAAMGLKEDGPMTPEQKKLVDRMYRSMVLGEVKTPPNQ
jgi:hypothetical protein